MDLFVILALINVEPAQQQPSVQFALITLLDFFPLTVDVLLELMMQELLSAPLVQLYVLPVLQQLSALHATLQPTELLLTANASVQLDSSKLSTLMDHSHAKHVLPAATLAH